MTDERYLAYRAAFGAALLFWWLVIYLAARYACSILL